MESQKGRLSVQGVVPLPGVICTFVWSAVRHSSLNVFIAERPGGIYTIVHFVPPVEQG